MANLSGALDQVRDELMAKRRKAFETRVQVLEAQYRTAIEFEEHSLNEDLDGIGVLFGGDEQAPKAVADDQGESVKPVPAPLAPALNPTGLPTLNP